MQETEPAQTERARRMRRPRQGRSEDAVAKIARAVVSLLAAEGPGALTHRRVAEVAGVSLAATTYYYPNKFEMVADAQARLLDEYVEAFIRAKARHRAGDPIVADLPALVLKLVRNAAGRHGRDTLAWSEIMLDCARDEGGHQLARAWFDRMNSVWRDLIVEFDVEASHDLVPPVIDTVVGLLFVTVSLRLSPDEVTDLLDDRRSLTAIAARLFDEPEERAAAIRRPAERSRDTRERIIGAAVAALEARDPAGLSFSAIAQCAGLTSAAPAYHFPTMDVLLGHAEEEVLRRMAERSATHLMLPFKREMAGDLLAAIQIRGLIEDGLADLAGYAAWLNAARKAERRTQVARTVIATHSAFARFLEDSQATLTPRFALALMAQFVGRSVRLMATGRRTADLAGARCEFEAMIAAIRDGAHPALRA